MSCRRLAVALVVAAGMTMVAAKPAPAPVSVECAVPPGMKTGDEADVVIRFRALVDLKQIDATVFAFKDLELVSDVREVVFRDVAKGTAPELGVRVRLTGPKWGSLAVTYNTATETRSASGAATIIFGATQ